MRSRFSRWSKLLLILIIGLTACDQAEEPLPTPMVTLVAVSGQPISVDLKELAADPAAYEGAHLQLSGQFARLPLLYCESEAHPSAATWTIGNDSTAVLAGGYDAQLRALLPDGLAITVTGRWQRWQGDVGCGKNSVHQDIWYLAVIDIVSPSPLVQITLTPEGFIADASFAQPTPPPTLTASGDGSPSPPDAGPIEPSVPAASSLTPASGDNPETTVTSAPTADSANATLTAMPTRTPVAAGTATPTVRAGVSVTPVTPSPTATTGDNPTSTSTPSATSPPPAAVGTATHTATPIALPTATTSNPTLTTVEMGSLADEELVTGSLGTDEIHAWDFNIGANDAITVSVASSPGLDIKITIVDELENIIWQRNQVASGAIERLNDAALPAAGDYQVRLVAANRAPGTYAMMLLFKDSYPFVPQFILNYGDAQTGSLAQDSDHFWFFHGSAGQTVTILLTPLDSGDLFFELYGPDGADLTGFIDDNVGGEPETLIDFDLPGTGMYSIRLGEYDFLPSNYQMELTGG